MKRRPDLEVFALLIIITFSWLERFNCCPKPTQISIAKPHQHAIRGKT
jgi:hypothetical protein